MSIKYSYRVHPYLARKIKCGGRISEIFARKLLEEIRQDFNLPHIVLEWYHHVEKKKQNWLGKILGFKPKDIRVGGYAVKGWGSINPRIQLFVDGHAVETLLHEIAHHMPYGWPHGRPWHLNFLRLIRWYNKKMKKIKI